MTRKISFLAFVLILFAAFSAFGQIKLKVTSPRANVRTDPSASAKIVATVVRGQRLSSSVQKDDWFYVGSLRGWIHKETVLTAEQEDHLQKWIKGELDFQKNASRKPISDGPGGVLPDLSNAQIKDEWLTIRFIPQKTLTLVMAINPSKIIRNGNDVQFWIRNIPSPVTTEFFERFYYKEAIPDAEKLKTFKWRLILYKGNCKNMTLAMIQMVDYWKDSHNSYEAPGPQFINVIPDSIGEGLLLEACNPE